MAVSDLPQGARTVLDVVTKYGLSVAEAGEVVSPCGHSTGRPMKSLGFKELHWFATRVTTTKQTREFRRAVVAARVLRAASELPFADVTGWAHA